MTDPYNQSREHLQTLKGDCDGVTVLSMRDEKLCDSCFEHDGTFYDLDEAIEKQPLPHDACTNETCRCTYRPVLDKKKLLLERRMQQEERMVRLRPKPPLATLTIRRVKKRNIMTPGDLSVGSIRLESFEHDLKLELGAVGAIIHGARVVGLVLGCRKAKPPASQTQS